MTEREARDRRAAAYSASCRRRRRERQRRRETVRGQALWAALAVLLLAWTARLLTI